MNCAREGCNQDAEYVTSMYCSAECRSLALRLSALRCDALLNGEEPPEMSDLLDRRERAKRWTPETMDERVESFKEAWNGTESQQFIG